MLLGDVGTGKSVCYYLPVAFVATSGCRAAIMLPNTNLANQIYSDFNSYYPELAPLLVTGSSQWSTDDLKKASVLIGTTALLFRDIGPIELLVIDEQQKLSNEQCNLLCNPDTHRISVSATPIPRTTALATYGAVKVEKITHCHAKKIIHTRILYAQDYQRLVSEILWTIHTAGKQALIVCSRKSDEQQADSQGHYQTVERVYEQFNAILPGLVACAHGGLSQEENQAALDSIKSGKMKLLVSTTVIEIGVTLPSLAYVAVFDAQQFGLNQLHQIRGRLVRHGGEGFLALYLPMPIKKPQSIRRLQLLTQTTDGHYIAKMDLAMRGCGDIVNGKTQHGSYQGLVRNVDVDIDDLENTLALLT